MSKSKILAVASSGGHWVQLMKIRSAWKHMDAVYMSTVSEYQNELNKYASENDMDPPRFYKTVVATRWQKFKLLRQLLDIVWVILRERPSYIVTTGAAPGFFAVKIGSLLGIKTVWIDSIANVEEMSLSGQKALSCADICLTQWEDLAEKHNSLNVNEAPKLKYWGSVL